MLRILTYSSLYPNASQPTHGVFVEQRLVHLCATGTVTATVVAPVPWFPLRSARFGGYARFASVPSREWRNGIEVHHPRFIAIPKIGMRLAPALMAAGTASNAIAAATNQKVDLIDAHYLFPDGVVAARLAKRLDRPYVLTARGSDVNLIGEISWCRGLMRKAIEGSAATVVVSAALRSRLLEWGVDPRQVVVIRNGVDFTRFNSGGRLSARPSARLALLSVGTLNENKGHHLVVDAMRRLPGATLTIAGEGPDRSALEGQIRACHLEDRVRLVGAVDHSDLPRYYLEADILVLASEREGLPNVVLEALASGTPVVATAVGGIPEAVDHPDLGELVSDRSSEAIADAIKLVHARRPEPERITARVRRFDWQTTSHQLCELMHSAAAQSP